MDKVEDMGLHYHKYYQLETSFYKTSLDNTLLNQLWDQYWHATLAASPFLQNQKEISNTVNDISRKIAKASESCGHSLASSMQAVKTLEENSSAGLMDTGMQRALKQKSRMGEANQVRGFFGSSGSSANKGFSS